MQPQALGRFVAKRAPVKLLDASSIVGSEAFDVRHSRSYQLPVVSHQL